LADDNTVEVLFFVKISDFTVRRFGETYYLQEFTGNITSLTGGLFDDLGDLSPAGRAILAMFLVVLSTLTITVATRSLSAGTVVGMMVLGGTVVGGLFPLEVVNGFNSGLAATTSLVVLGFLLITDQLVGRVRT